MKLRHYRKWISVCLSLLLVVTFMAPAMACEMEPGQGQETQIERDVSQPDCHSSETEREPAPDETCPACLAGCMSQTTFAIALATPAALNGVIHRMRPSEENTYLGSHPQRLFRPPAFVPAI